MNIVNIDQLNDCRTVVLVGRNAGVREVAKQLSAPLYYVPRIDDYFEDYPEVVGLLKDSVGVEDRVVCITTQSLEFLDSLLSSDMDFKIATVQFKDDTYRLRVHTKEEALALRNDCDMDLRK